MSAKFVSVADAASLIPDGSTLWIEGSSGGVSEPGTLYAAVSQRFEAEGHPRDVTLVHSNGIGDWKGRGTDLFAREGLIKKVIGGHFGFSPRLVEMFNQGKVEAYNIPQGVLAQLVREIAAKRPGLLTHVGLHTFVDPRQTGGALNGISNNPPVELVNFRGREYLFYQAFPVDVVFIRGTFADEDGNISMENEVSYLNMLAAAQAGHNSGGKVIAQVKYRAARGALDPRLIKVPGILVDYVVVDGGQWQTFEAEFDPALCGAIRIPLKLQGNGGLNERKVIARRAAMELRPGVINLGFGLSSEVAGVAAEEGLADDIVLTIEQGAIGGVPASGLIFGCARNPQSIVEQPSQFDFYDGGGIDITFLGLAQMDQAGNVNVSKFGDRISGVGGFINITQGAKKIVYCGTMTTGGLKVEISGGRVKIIQEGKIRKLVKHVEHVTFSARFARERKTPVLYITERCIFRLTPTGVLLEEIAPGIDLEKDILAQMDFRPEITPDLKVMDPRIFKPELMSIKDELINTQKI